VGVVASLLDPKQTKDFDQKNRDEQQKLRELFAHKQNKPILPIETARANRLSLSFGPGEVSTPSFTGRRVVDDVSLEQIARYIDWTFFFTTWELRGRFPAILEHAESGAAARELFDNGKRLLDRILKDRSLRARGVYGFWPAASSGDDIVLFTDEERKKELLRFVMLRQQEAKTDD